MLEIDHHLLNSILILVIFAYIIYLLFFLETCIDLKNLINSVVNNKLGRLIILLAITFCSIPNKLKVCGPTVGILLFVAYLLTIVQFNNSEGYHNQEKKNDVTPVRPGDKALSLGVPDPIPQRFMNEPIEGTPGPCANSGVAHAFNMH